MKNNYKRLKMVVLVFVAVLLAMLAFSATAKAAPIKYSPQQEIEISGTVKDENGLPVGGATVAIEGLNRGTITDMDGEFTLFAPPNAVLVISYLGFTTQNIPIDNRDEIHIIMEEDVDALGEVKINAGYYNTTERERTGSISRVKGEEIELQPLVSPIQALQGRMAGVEIIPGGSNPGTASTIRIRGINSLREEGNYPLYIIDGVPINSIPIESNSLMSGSGIDPLNNLDLANIESIEVLKDADATAIYGSRGANGVILITTRRGKTTGTGLETRIYTGIATVPNRLNLLNTEEYLRIRRKALENDGVEPTDNNAYDLTLWDQNRYTDWQELLFGGTSKTTNANAAFSGGDEYTSFRVGGSYFNQGTIYPGDYDYQKVTGNLNLNHRSKDNKVQLNFSLSYGVDVNNLVGNINYNSQIALLPPNAPQIFNEDGGLEWEQWELAGLDNPLRGYYNKSTTETNSLITNASVGYEFFPGFQFKTNLGYTSYDSEELRKQPASSYNPSNVPRNLSIHLNSTRKSWIIEPQLIYNKDFDRFRIEGLIGLTFQENTQDQLSFQGIGYASEALIGNIAAAEDILTPELSNTEYRYNAIFGRIGMNWARKYYVNFTGRRDGSSRFGPNNRFANFGAIGGAWIFTEEAFFKNNLSFISFGKFRGSYGTTGNDQIGDYGYLDAYEATRGPGGLYPTTLANPDYSWEINEKLEAGIELGLLRDRIRFGVSWYKNSSSNQLVGYSLPYITGFTSVQANLPATVENKGWEIELNTSNVDTRNFKWQTSFNISIPENELISYPDIDQSAYANTYRVGHPLNISLLYQYEGLDPETGLYTIKDVNEDGRLDFEDRTIIHDRNRKYFGGFNNNFSFKNFSLQFLWEFVKQEGIMTLFSAGGPANTTDVVLSSLNDQGIYQRPSYTVASRTAFNNVIQSNFPIQDASYLRLKTLSIGYDIPNTKKIGLENARLFLHGQNLFTITSYEGMDPEVPTSGISIGGLRTLTGGIEINF